MDLNRSASLMDLEFKNTWSPDLFCSTGTNTHSLKYQAGTKVSQQKWFSEGLSVQEHMISRFLISTGTNTGTNGSEQKCVSEGLEFQEDMSCRFFYLYWFSNSKSKVPSGYQSISAEVIL